MRAVVGRTSFERVGDEVVVKHAGDEAETGDVRSVCWVEEGLQLSFLASPDIDFEDAGRGVRASAATSVALKFGTRTIQ